MSYLKHRIGEFYLPKDTEETMPIALELWMEWDGTQLNTVFKFIALASGTIPQEWSPTCEFGLDFWGSDPDKYDAMVRITSASAVYVYLYGEHAEGDVIASAKNGSLEPAEGGWGWTDSAVIDFSYLFNLYTDGDGENWYFRSGGARGAFSYTVLELKSTLYSPTIILADVPAFDNTSNATIKYNCDASGFSDAETRIGIFDVDGVQILAYKSIPVDGASYVYELTAEDHSKLMAKITSGTSTTLHFKLEYRVYVLESWSSWLVGDSFTTTYSINTARPVIEPKVVVVDQSIINLTGNDTTLIRYCSYARCTLDAYPSDSGTYIAKRVVIYNGETREIAAGAYIDINIKETSKFTFRATDARGNMTEESITLDMVEYVPLTCNLVSASAPDAATGIGEFVVKGNCFSQSFGAQSNTLSIQYRYKLASGNTFSDWISVDSSEINILTPLTYSCGAEIPDLDYTEAYEVEIRALDALNTVTLSTIKLTAVPVFDWSKNDFNFNVPVTMTDTTTGTVLNVTGLIKAMTELTPVTPQYYTSGSGGWSTFEMSNAYILGNMLHLDLYAVGGTVSAGKTNTVIGNAIIYHGGKIADAPLTITFSSGKGSPVSTLYTMSHAVTSTHFTFTIMMSATAGSTNTINAHLAIPVVLNTDAFIQ